MSTLSLCMIVRNEEHNLPRLFESIRGLFDEVVVVDTGSVDKTIKVATDFGAKVSQFEWVNDFSAARNFSFSKATCDYIQWLDADDILLPDAFNQIKKLKENLQADVYIMEYDYSQDEFGNSTAMTPLHRILRRDPQVQWNDEVHEWLSFPPHWRVSRTPIIISHRRSASDQARDAGRNSRLLAEAVKKRPDNSRLRFYYAKELFYTRRWQETIDAFKAYFKKPDWHDNKIHAYWLLGQCYMNLGKDEQAIDTFISGIKLDPRWAELHNAIGQIYYNKSQWTEAIRWFEIAKNCKIPDSIGFVTPENYTFVPADRLCKCYGELGDFRRAQEMNDIVLRLRPTDERLLFNRLLLRDRLFLGREARRPIRLNLGSGGKSVSTYLNTDLYVTENVQEIFSLDNIPYESGTVHGIYSEHSLEHISHQAARNALTEWARVLRYGGNLVLKIPDLDACCKKYIEAKPGETCNGFDEKEWYRYTIFGYQKGANKEPAENQFHKTGFTKAEIQELLTKRGFEDITINEYDGWKTPSLEVKAILKKQTIKVAWMLVATDEDYPTSRIRALNVSRWLNENNISSEIFPEYTKASVESLFSRLKFKDVVIFFKNGPLEIELITKLQRAGIANIYDYNELVPGQDEIINAVNLVTCCSTVLANNLQRSRTIVIPDAYELPDKVEAKAENVKLKIISCSMGGSQANVEPLRPIIEKLDMELVRISEWPEHEIRWKRETWLQELSKADIVLCAQRHWLEPAKSNNRCTQAMALGLPVVASPLQSYSEAVIHEKTGLICKTSEDWEKYLTLLRDNPELRKTIGAAAKEAVKEKYSIEVIGKKWIEVCEELCCENCGSF